MNDGSEDSEGTLVFRRSDFDDGRRGRFPEDLRQWKPALRLIQLIDQEIAGLPAESALSPDGRKLAAILLWCLSTGRYNSWDIEALCEEEPLTHHVAAGLKPAHSDIHRFRRDHESLILLALAHILSNARPEDEPIVGTSVGADITAEALRRYEQARYADTLPPD